MNTDKITFVTEKSVGGETIRIALYAAAEIRLMFGLISIIMGLKMKVKRRISPILFPLDSRIM